MPGGASVVGCSVVADETDDIQQAILKYTDNDKVLSHIYLAHH